jgi:hypothetical protein
MSKSQKVLDLTTKVNLIERQRVVWMHAEAIERAQKMEIPLPAEVSEWLWRALKNIACGTDANVAFDVVPEKQGVRKDGFLKHMQQKITNGYIAAATEETAAEPKLKKTSEAIKEISKALPDMAQSTVRKNWNRSTTDRKPTFTLGKK